MAGIETVQITKKEWDEYMSLKRREQMRLKVMKWRMSRQNESMRLEEKEG